MKTSDSSHPSFCSAPVNLLAVTLSEKQFQRITETVYRLCGINLRSGKEELVKSRLLKRLRALNMSSFDDYIHLLGTEAGGSEMTAMIDCLTTNKTSFFREEQHFYYLKDKILPAVKGTRLRIWCAGCSTGEEPYSIAITLREALPKQVSDGTRILATDISTRVLERAREGVYGQEALADVGPHMLATHFTCIDEKKPRRYRVSDSARSLVRFARLNLMESWPMQGPFDVIFCRNVMIYFDKETQQNLIGRYARLLAPGGHLFVGHSESLAGITHALKYIQPAVYRKE